MHSQTVRRKSQTASQKAYPSPKTKRSKKPFWIIFLLILIVSAGYYYKDSLPDLLKFAKSGGIENTTNRPETDDNTEPVSIPIAESNNNYQYYSPIEKKIQLEILNGCGEKGVAKLLTDLLKKSNYDIVNSGNYMQKGKVNWDVSETKIIDQIGKDENAKDLADLMGIQYSNVEVFENPSPISDITIVIGKDYKTLEIFK